jgi:hypothetical protein
MEMYKSSGEIYFYPKKYSNKAWAIINCEIGIVEYYQYWIEKLYKIKLQKPKHGAHITCIREEQIKDEVYDELWTKNQNKTIIFEYSNKIETNGEHFWLPIICEEIFDIREEMGLVRKGEFSLHLTIGRLAPKDMEWFNIDYFNIK